MYAALGIVFTAGCCCADPPITPQFEVASVRRVSKDAPRGFFGGPGSADPGRASWSRARMGELLDQAFGLNRADVLGPSWLDSEYYAVNVTMPTTTQMQEFRLMLVQLLVDRFHLAFHRQTKEERGYELVVAKGGPKLTPSPVQVWTGNVRDLSQTRAPGKQDITGFPVLRNGTPWEVQRDGDVIRATFECSMDVFANALSILINVRSPAGGLSQPPRTIAVLNKTGLSGTFSFRLEYDGDPDGMPSTLRAAVQARLGLRLVESKLMHDQIVIDHLERVPTEE